MPPEHPGDPRLGTALVVSAILGLVSFWGVFLVLASVAIRIGIVRLHLLVRVLSADLRDLRLVRFTLK